MKNLTRLQKIILFFAIIIFLLGCLGVYFLMINPLWDKQDRVEQSLSTEQLLLSKIKKQHEELKNVNIIDDSLALQRQLPLQPFYEQLFYDLDEAQSLTNSVVQNFTISDQNELELPEELNQEGLMAVTIDLEVQSPTYNDMMAFIQDIEARERIISIDHVTFTQPEVAGEELTFQITFTAFYSEGFDRLRDHQPTIDIPQPENKTNPFPF